MNHLYPKDLASYITNHWNKPAVGVAPGRKKDVPGALELQSEREFAQLPVAAELEQLLSTCFQASLLRHEDTPVVFRIIVAEPEEFPADGGPPTGLHRLEFTECLPFTAHELSRLSSAASFSRTMIGVRVDPQHGAEIWGMVHTGPRWLHASHGGRGTPPPLPLALIVHVTGPGCLEVARGNEPLANLSEGRVFGPSMNVFQSHWLQNWFAPIREERFELHNQAKQQAETNWVELDPDLTTVIDQHMMKRVIAAVRAFRHGGTLIMVPPGQAHQLALKNPYLSMKYQFADSEPRARFRTLIVSVMNVLASLTHEVSHPIGWIDYQQTTNQEIMALDEAIFEMSHLVSGLSTADGAVVLTKRFELLGFGAEIHCDSSDVSMVAKALDLEGDRYRMESVHSVGTRHRSAYRLCQQLQDALAIIISQDGSVQFARWHKTHIMCWDHQAAFKFSTVY
jgi:DisA bacterial checkpoint controller nucleotide-binding